MFVIQINVFTGFTMQMSRKLFCRKLTKLAILISEALLHEKNPVEKCYPSGNRIQAASDSKSNMLLSTLT